MLRSERNWATKKPAIKASPDDAQLDEIVHHQIVRGTLPAERIRLMHGQVEHIEGAR